ncbi:alpha-amylase family glycosyl hydrolase [Ruania zhangjianzhongii]|uniref:alpha-amylase family glycosyl hydrolase n=1 Tax=Ruania zhangjianzhongii TaxID=2603206 RepID=UPI0011CA4C8C|nr:alpha-amylase family glycosyl hydrolase [Ruania zhangjianzhongii]
MPTRSPTATPRPWWRDAVIYEVYIRSLADSDGDGTGDLQGVIDRLDHIQALGVDAVWITPFFPSPGHDHGYDVSDFRGIDPAFGDTDTFRRLVDELHERGMRLLVDVVPNHTSHEHPWFQAALAEGRDGVDYRDYYLWADPAGDGGPPNNWLANFGGSAWTWEPESEQYYLHAYLPEQPDLNWRNPRVFEEWVAILEHWIELGADGFRIDVAHNLLKHPDLPDNPVLEPTRAENVPAGRVRSARGLARVYDVDQDDVVDLYTQLRARLPRTHAGEDPFLLGETVLENPERVERYLESGRLDAAMWFGTDRVPFDAAEVAQVLRTPSPDTAGRFGWFLSNHDRARPASRLGSADRALALSAAVLAMPGPYLLYQGEELGMIDLEIDPSTARDPIALRAGELDASRDRARSPIPWTDEPGRGFSSAEPWLAHGPLPEHGSAATQRGNDTSHLNRWRSLLTTWARLRDTLPVSTAVDHHDDLLTLTRGALAVQINFGTEALPLKRPAGAEALWRSQPGGDPATLRAAEAVWLYRPGEQ